MSCPFNGTSNRSLTGKLAHFELSYSSSSGGEYFDRRACELRQSPSLEIARMGRLAAKQ